MGGDATLAAETLEFPEREDAPLLNEGVNC
jgi:hypothetical protein